MPSVNDYDVANASGAAVRSDLNNIFEAIQTCNSESAELDGTKCKKGMWFLHGNTLKICKSVVESGGTTTASFAVIGDITLSNCGLLNASGATMTGVFKIDDSTSHTTPALSFDGDEDLGLFRKDADQMGFACANAEQMIFDANGLTLQAGNNLRFADSDSTNYVALKAPGTVGEDYTLTLPTATGGSGQFLKTDGSGQLSFASVTSTQALTVNGNLTVTGTVSGSGASLTNIPSAQLTGALPAIDGSNLTGISTATPAIEVGRLNGDLTLTQAYDDYTTILTVTIDPSTSGTALLVQMMGEAEARLDDDGQYNHVSVRLRRGTTQLIERKTQGGVRTSVLLDVPIKDTHAHNGSPVTYTIQAKRTSSGGNLNPRVKIGTSLLIQEII